MAGLPIPVMPTWHALPPEINTSRLMLGAGSAPMLQAASAWEAFALSLEVQADELAASLAQLAATWTGAASERAISAITPAVLWMRTTSLQAHKRALQAAAQATAHATALAETPPIPEIEENHVTHAVLEATNFLGINTVPIGLNEEDYFVRMWNQAAAAMDAYHAETLLNTTFEPVPPLPPIVIPGVAEAVGAAGVAAAAAMAPGAAAREAAIAHVAAQATAESTALQVGRVASTANQAAALGENKAERAGETAANSRTAQQPQDQLGQQGMQMMSQVASQIGQVPQQAGQLLQSPMQQLTQPLQQVSSLFSQMGHGDQAGTSLAGASGRGAQVGLLGASPFSTHPLAGGGGPSAGAGLVRGASLPGAGGLGARTPMLAGLLGVGESGLNPASVAAGAAAGSTATGLAPVAANNAGGVGAGPMGGLGHRGTSGGVRQSLGGPDALEYDTEEEDADDW
ncbi:MAG: PPE family protein [Mycobacterium sp.]|nr:PPE family protein [Mycobacterium sp.]